MPKIGKTLKGVKQRGGGNSTALHPYLTNDLYKRVRVYCATNNLSVSGFAEKVFEEYLSGKSDNGNFIKHLSRHGHRLDVIDGNVNILIESFGLFLQFWFAHTPQIPDDQKKSANLQGQERYGAFLKYLQANLLEGRRFMDQFVEDVGDQDELRNMLEKN